jgi:hypothetical protein
MPPLAVVPLLIAPAGAVPKMAAAATGEPPRPPYVVKEIRDGLYWLSDHIGAASLPPDGSRERRK